MSARRDGDLVPRMATNSGGRSDGTPCTPNSTDRGVEFPLGPRCPTSGSAGRGGVARSAAPRGRRRRRPASPTRTQLQARRALVATASAQLSSGTRNTVAPGVAGGAHLERDAADRRRRRPSASIAPVPATNRPPVSSPGVSLSTTASANIRPGRRAADVAEADPDVAGPRLDAGPHAEQALLRGPGSDASTTSASRCSPAPPVGDRRPTAPARCRASASDTATRRVDRAARTRRRSSSPTSQDAGRRGVRHQLARRRPGVGHCQLASARPPRRWPRTRRTAAVFSCSDLLVGLAGREDLARAARPGGRATPSSPSAGEQRQPVGDRHRGHVQVPGRRDRSAARRRRRPGCRRRRRACRRSGPGPARPSAPAASAPSTPSTSASRRGGRRRSMSGGSRCPEPMAAG